jgi:DNA invertase Pin-like site-specific DNA recombinase
VLGGGLDDLVKLVALMVQAKVDLIAEAEGIDTTLPEGRAWMVTIASLQRYQQAMRSRKARAGQHRAKDAGVRFGRPSVPDAIIHNVRKALTDGAGIRPTARKWGVSPARVLSEKRLVTDGAAGPSTATIMQSFPVVT